MTQFMLQRRSSRIELGEPGWLSKLAAFAIKRRWRFRSTEKLSDHLLRDAGLERIGGLTRRRMG